MNNIPEGKTYPGDNREGTLPGQEYGNTTSYRAQQVPGQDDAVHHPSHYANGRFEVIDIIEDQLGVDGLRGFCLGNTLKYICRAGKKDKTKTLEDLEKAEWYLHHFIERMKETKTGNE